MNKIKKLNEVDFNNCYILCLCEGKTEWAIIDILLDNKKLKFSREALVGEKVHLRMSGDELTREFLQFDYDKELIIFRILDSVKENLCIKKPYNRYQVFNFYTSHEIELVFIHYDNLYKEFEKKKSIVKASEFYKSQNNNYNKSYEYAINYLDDIEKLTESIKKSKRKDKLGIYDLMID